MKPQFQKTKPLAFKLFRELGCSSLEAWVEAINKCKRITHMPVDAIQQIVSQARTFSALTSGVERTFAKKLRYLDEHKSSASASFESCMLKIVCDRVKSEEARVIEHAREVWAEVYGEVRASPKSERADKGVKQKAKKQVGEQMGEAEWLNKRKRAINQAVAKHKIKHSTTKKRRAKGKSMGLDSSSSSSSSSASSSDSSINLTEKQKKEIDFQHQKIKKRKLECHMQGALLAHESEENTADFKELSDRQENTTG